MKKTNVLIMGAAGRDFHNFLTYFKNNKNFRVIGFTAEQIPGISNRKFPAKLSGKLYKNGIPIFHESKLKSLIKKYKIDDVYLSYSDLSHSDVMNKASTVLAAGANFCLLGTEETQIKSRKPLISVTAVRTGAGKSQTSRKIARILRDRGYKVVAIRHPMPYGDLVKQEVQRFTTYDDMLKHKCTIEEREEYDPWVKLGIPIYAGVDYYKILKSAEKEADVIIWDGGNNDMSFYKPDLNVVVLDPHRAGHEMQYYPGEVNFKAADVFVINKVDSAPKEGVKTLLANIKEHNSSAIVIKAQSQLVIEKPQRLKNKKVLIVGDGPTLTHGGMSFGAGTIAADKYHAKIVKPFKFITGTLKETYKKYPHLIKSTELPAMGYTPKQNKDLENTINKSKVDLIIDGTPINLKKHIKIKKEFIEVNYVLKEIGKIKLTDVLKRVKIKKK